MEYTTQDRRERPTERTGRSEWILVRAFGARGAVVEGVLSPDVSTAAEAAADMCTRQDVERVEMSRPVTSAGAA
ncbi:hypothetical protein O4J56_24465 [Nocardiopsis sp. RSe5-2]|uniref:Uncharacterized protein n=1 Tax=Nocardiopsis endophytica TaxID=3018445 RepID=A0ABT4UBX9_9ACTN|nr:hypothetical protein [Nocardiopsis endophytica]MDA2813822.1 hypothetical protein [Nocardiopsis endophytica]